MRVMKFGGTSVGSPERMKHVASLVTKQQGPIFVVLSAMSGTTNSLIEISQLLSQKDVSLASDVIDALEEKYIGHANELLSTDEYRQKVL